MTGSSLQNYVLSFNDVEEVRYAAPDLVELITRQRKVDE